MSRLGSVFLMFALAVLMAGCTGNTDPAEVIEAYLQARLDSDVEQLRSLSCASWESQVMLEANSFKGRESELQGMACKADGTNGDHTIVRCAGKIVVTYQGEQNEFPLGDYEVIQEDGEWKMCGEAG